jgi:predicted transcriptional regulator of viral defense system
MVIPRIRANSGNVFLSFQAALQVHGLFDQSLQTVTSVCLKQRAATHLQGTVYQYVATTADHYFGFRAYGLDGQRVQIAEAEKALIDLLQFHRTSATVDLVLETLRDNRHQLELARLTQYALRSPIAVQRAIGFLLDGLRLDSSALSAAVHKSTSASKLTAASRQYNHDWRLYYEPFVAREMS